MKLPIISVVDNDYQLRDILMRDVLAISKMKADFHERQLTQILRTIVGDSCDPTTKKPVNVQKLTCEERYAVFLNYLDLTRDQNELSREVDIAEFLNFQSEGFTRERISNGEGVTIRHLNGIEAEALEMGCETTHDWVLGAMAITIGCEKLPAIDMTTTIEYCGKMIKNRMLLLEELEIDEFNELMGQYLSLQHEQIHLVNLAFEKGIVLERIEKRGTDDAPVRFQPRTAFGGYCKNVISNSN